MPAYLKIDSLFNFFKVTCAYDFFFLTFKQISRELKKKELVI